MPLPATSTALHRLRRLSAQGLTDRKSVSVRQFCYQVKESRDFLLEAGAVGLLDSLHGDGEARAGGVRVLGAGEEDLDGVLRRRTLHGSWLGTDCLRLFAGRGRRGLRGLHLLFSLALLHLHPTPIASAAQPDDQVLLGDDSLWRWGQRRGDSERTLALAAALVRGGLGLRLLLERSSISLRHKDQCANNKEVKQAPKARKSCTLLLTYPLQVYPLYIRNPSTLAVGKRGREIYLKQLHGNPRQPRVREGGITCQL